MERNGRCIILGLLSLSVAIAATTLSKPLRGPDARAAQQPPRSDLATNIVVQAFPARGFDPTRLPNPRDPFDDANYPGRDTVWVIEWNVTNAVNGPFSSVLRITVAHFGYLDKDRKRRWITVVRDLELGEIFVPYDDGSHRYRDIEENKFRLRQGDPALLGPPCLAPGEILHSDRPGMDGLVYKEVHDDGVRLIDKRPAVDVGRRGEKLVLWVNLHGANYRYIIEYNFSDDGTITSRLGATGQNLNDRDGLGRPGPDAHLHVGCWMFDPDLGDPTGKLLGGPKQNVVQLVRRVQDLAGNPNGHFRVDVSPFPRGCGSAGAAVAGSAQWSAEQFTVLRIESKVRCNGSGSPQPTAYDLIPMRAGSCRSFPTPRYDYATRDFWVTPADPPFTMFMDFPKHVGSPPAPVDQTAIRVGHNSPIWHVPRGEDFGTDGVSRSDGAALTTWSGFMLRPRNLFDGTPFLH